MTQLIDWFGNPIPVAPQPDPKANPCLAVYGPGPEGKTCSECALLVGIAKARTYYKCRLRRNTNGPATDHKRRWPACGKFEQREGSIPLYDGR